MTEERSSKRCSSTGGDNGTDKKGEILGVHYMNSNWEEAGSLYNCPGLLTGEQMERFSILTSEDYPVFM